jgi:hypothetical protein
MGKECYWNVRTTGLIDYLADRFLLRPLLVLSLFITIYWHCPISKIL